MDTNFLNAKCSAFTWDTLDNNVLFARNYDFNRITDDSKIIIIPRNLEFYTVGCSFEKNLDENSKFKTKYASIGVGTNVLKPTPTLYEGTNEHGLACAQLFFRNLAKFNDEYSKTKINIQPAFLVTFLLSMCKDTNECVKMLEENISLYSKKLLGSDATIHFIITDKTKNTVIVEQEADGLHIYKENFGILTNSPNYKYHMFNITNYFNLNNLDIEILNINNVDVKQIFSGQGMLGLPGDFSSPSRFIRLAFLKKYAIKGNNEAEGVNYLFRIMQNVSYPYGLCKALGNGEAQSFDKDVSEYDYTIYTSVFSLTNKKVYITTYNNQNIRCVSLMDYIDTKDVLTFNFNVNQKFEEIKKDN